MKRAVVKLEVYVTIEVPDHVYERDKEDIEMKDAGGLIPTND